MFEIREYENGSYSILFDTDFEFNVFRHFIEKRYIDMQVCLLKMDDNFGIICNRIAKDQDRLDDFTVTKIRRDTKKEFGFELNIEKDGIIQMDDYLAFTGELVVKVLSNDYKQEVDFDEEEVLDDNEALSMHTIAYMDEIPDFVYEIMDRYYEV